MIALLAAIAIAQPTAAPGPLGFVDNTAAHWTAPEAVQQRLENVCRIYCPLSPNQGAAGSGTYLGDGLVLTAHHVIDGHSPRVGAITATFPDAQGRPVGAKSRARVLAVDATWDQALLQLENPPQLRGVPLARRNPQPGDAAILAGYSTGRLALRPGRVVQYTGRGWMRDHYNTDRRADQGDSGGAMFTKDGRLIGNVFATNVTGALGQITGRTHKFLAAFLPRLRAWEQGLEAVRNNGGRVLITPIFRRAVVNPPPTQPAQSPPIPNDIQIDPAMLTQCGPGGCYASPFGGGERSPFGPRDEAIPAFPGGGGGYGSNPTTPNQTQPMLPPNDPKPDPIELKLGVGNTVTLPPGSQARVEIRQGQDGAAWLDFYIPAGQQGPTGQAGLPGQPPAIDPERLAQAIAPHLPPITVQTVDEEGHASGRPAVVPLGGQLNLHHRLIEPPLVPVQP